MTPINIIESVYREAFRPVLNLDHLEKKLRHWYQAFPKANYLQPCVIDGMASLICQKHLSDIDHRAYLTLKAICAEYGIYLKEDSREPHGYTSDFFHNRRRAVVILTFCLTMASNVYATNVRGHTFAISTHTESQFVSIVVNNQTLFDVASKITEQTGIRFKFDAAVENDIINKRLAASNWRGALDQLLQRYNYMTIQDGNVIKTILISGYKGGIKPSSDHETDQELYAASNTYPPQDVFDNRIITDITIPAEELANLPEGGEMMVDLPVGTFNIKRESMVALDDGTLSWVGIMDDETQFYRLYLTRNQDGEVVGTTYTPNGTYNIETIDGQTVMIEVNQASMR